MATKESKRKRLQDLEISDNFIFTRLMLDKQISLEIASALLGLDIYDLEYLETEKTMDIAYDSKSSRFDCLIKSENRVINIEMQVNEKGNLVIRARYYRIIIGMDNLSAGEEYTNLPEVYVIFICKFDPFKKGLVKYDFQSYDVNAKILENNKEHTLYFNTTALDKLEEGKLKELLKLVEGIPSEDEFSLRLQRRINEIKGNVKWQRDYMKYSADLIDERIEGKKEGLEQGLELGKSKQKFETAINLFDILDDETISKKLELELSLVKELRLNYKNKDFSIEDYINKL